MKGVQGYEYATDVGINVAGQEPGPQIVQKSLLVEVGQLAEVRILLVTGLAQEAVEIVLQPLGVHREPALSPQVLWQLLPQVEPGHQGRFLIWSSIMFELPSKGEICLLTAISDSINGVYHHYR